MILLFFILTCTVGRQQVIKYRDEYLRCRTAGEVTTYSGRIDGQKAVFTVSPGPVVEYSLGDAQYGPYTVVFDPTAVLDEDDKPVNLISTQSLVGVELWESETRLFRGAYLHTGSTFYLVDMNGEMLFSDGMFLLLGSGSTSAGQAPGPYTILKLAIAPDVVRRGSFGIFLLGVLVCVLCAVSILYADALFRWNLRFIINDPENAEPSDWALFSRWIGWIVLTIAALAFFILGLNCG